MTPADLAQRIRKEAEGRGRFITALAGPPGAGKSTLAAAVVAALGEGARVVPMDGFHYDDRVLAQRGLTKRKGAPETFDVLGFLHLMHRLREGGEVAIPVFDRQMELSRAAADVVTDEDRFLVVEGNYLLLEKDPWRRLRGFFDLTVFLDVPFPELERRLVQRGMQAGRTPEAAADWANSNDLPNARRVLDRSCPADAVIRWQ
ncbi:nucleoside/nucleotide kinase family protein [Rhodobacter sp. CZR27]|uniref:nucleoside/nucleotide kinase family protein n=1 Tax=Rhodobacter sp. CZR27 TaxID=2033869 RepID=UPI000BBE3E99|nr:nucleoside/nucleotide kinase family protein [Rhodobacter sp. CZR27]